MKAPVALFGLLVLVFVVLILNAFLGGATVPPREFAVQDSVKAEYISQAKAGDIVAKGGRFYVVTSREDGVLHVERYRESFEIPCTIEAMSNMDSVLLTPGVPGYWAALASTDPVRL